MRRKELTPEAALAQARKAAAAGKVVIGNKAAQRGADDVVVLSPRRGGLVFQWSRLGVGFGELTLAVVDGQLHVDNEGMGLTFCLDVIQQALMETEPFKPVVTEPLPS